MAEQKTNDLPRGKEDLQIIRGIPFIHVFKREIIEEVFEFMPKDDDVIVASYPKTGTTWMQYIVLQILTEAECFPTFDDLLERVVPYMEMTGVSAVEAITRKPRVYKHHMPYNVMKKNPKAKIIYVYRKPEDTLVSFYHILNNLRGPIDFDEHFDNFINGRITYGRYFEHVLSYLQHKDDRNILFVSYEKLKIHTREKILRVAKFLGQKYYTALLNNQSLLDKIIKQTSFDNMKKNLKATVPEDPNEDHLSSFGSSKAGPQKEINFFRKGTIGDGKETLSSSQLDQLKRVAEEVMQGTSVFSEWYDDSF